MILRATHRTLYRYSMPSIESHNEVRLMPMNSGNQRCLEFRLTVNPPCKVFSYDEPGGTVHYFGVRSAHPLLEIVAEAVVETYLENPIAGLNLVEPDWDFYDLASTRQENAEFLAESPYVSLFHGVRQIGHQVLGTSGGMAVDFVQKLAHWINKSLAYDPDATHVHTKLDEVLQLRAGVCQDFAHLMIACCRAVGVPARYISGYLYVGGRTDMRGELATHAWVECLLPGGRWLAIDPTNDLLMNDRYASVHIGRDYSDVTPTRGVYVGTPAKSLEVTVNLDKIDVYSPVS